MRCKALLVAALAACAPATASREPLHYPAMRAPTTGSSMPAAFVPAPEAAPTTLACSEREPELANALDDDCDGRIDGVADEAALVVAIAHPAAVPLRFFFRNAADERERPLAASSCAPTAPFCVLRLDTATLSHGRHDLWVTSAAAAPAAAAASLAVSVRAEGKVATYLLRLEQKLEQKEAQRVGQLSLP